MEIRIGKMVHQLEFEKIRFIRGLDKIYKAESDGIEFGMGVILADIYLKQGSVPALVNVIRCAINAPVSLDAIDSVVEKIAEENDGLDQLFEEVREEMGKSPIVKSTLKRVQEAQNQVKANQEEQEQN